MAICIISLAKLFFKFYRRYYDFISKFQFGLKSLLHQVFSDPEFYADLVYELKKTVGSNNFSARVSKRIIKRLAITLMYCYILHAWWTKPSWLASWLSSLIAGRWLGLQTLWRFDLKTCTRVFLQDETLHSLDGLHASWTFLVLQQQQNLGRRFDTSKMHLGPRWLRLLSVLRRWFCCWCLFVYCYSHCGSL